MIPIEIEHPPAVEQPPDLVVLKLTVEEATSLRFALTRGLNPRPMQPLTKHTYHLVEPIEDELTTILYHYRRGSI